jgi:SAM-dependent methyltransferase
MPTLTGVNMSLYTKRRTYSREAEEDKIIGDRLYYEMHFKNGMKILDVGCSTGTFVMNDPKNIVGLDADRDAIEIAKEKGLNCSLFDVNNKKLPYEDNTFDGVNCKSIFAHMKTHLRFLNEVKRVMKPGAKLVIFTANIKILKFKFFEDYTHISPFTEESIGHLLFDAGFKNFKVYNLPIRMPGMGYLYRNKILTAKKVCSIEKFIVNSFFPLKIFTLFDKRVNLAAECYK